MTLNLKRKRGKDVETHDTKKRQLSPENESDGAQSVIDEDAQGAQEDNGFASEEVGSEGEGEEDEEWGGIGASGETTGGQHERGGKPKKPPTGEEVRAIKEATDLFRSSSFKLQIDALLPNVRPKPSRMAPLDRFLFALHSCLSTLPSVPPQHPLEAARALLNGDASTKTNAPKIKKDKGKAKSTATTVPIAVPYPLPLPTEDANWKVAFEKPTDVLLVGSWANKVGIKEKDGEPWGVDVAVEMPSNLFQEKDYLNGRFFHKRAYYLSVIARSIVDPKSGLNVDAFYESKGEDPRLTTLVLRPRQDNSPNDFTKLNAQVRIIPVLPTTSPIPFSRLSPYRSNFRVHTVTDSDASSSHPPSENVPTPLYNTALLLSTTPKAHLLSVHALKQDIPAYADALALLRIWANQRGYGEGKKMCVRGFEGRGAWWGGVLEMLVLGEEPVGAGTGEKMAKRRPLGKGLSSYQLFKAALDFLARHDFEKGRIFVKSQSGHRFSPEEYAVHHKAVFVDSSSTVNLLAGVPLASLEMLRHDAKLTLEILDNNTISNDPFPDTFLKERRELPNKFDAVIRVDLSSAKLRRPSVHDTLEWGSPANALFASIASFLRRGLGQRIKAVAILHPSSQPRPLSQAHPSSPSLVCIGLVYNPEHAFRLVDHGPAASEADSKAAEEFREFWGEKAELRRFKDGSIVESVVWEVKNADERAHVPVMVIRHLLSRHFGVGAGSVQTWQPAFDGLLRLPESISSLYQAAGMSAGFKAAMTAFDDLVKTLKGLDSELPLSILNVSPVSEYLRYTSVFNPVAIPASAYGSLTTCARYSAPMEVILEFERSSRWPDDLRAIQKMKLAFLERLAAVLMNANEGVRARIVVGDGVLANVSQIRDQARLEIVVKQGWVFSARIWHEREATLLDRIINEQARVPKALQLSSSSDEPGKAREREEAVEAMEMYTRQFVHASRHHRAVAALCHRFSAFAGTVRLVKRWLASHWLLRCHIGEEVVEILCASVFVGSGQGRSEEGVPASRERGFARIIEKLKEWQWTEGIFVPMYGEAVAANGEVNKVAVSAGTKSVWTVGTEFDKGGHMWTAQGPDVVVAHRVRALANATWDCLQGMESGALDVKSLFVHPVDDYDFVVQLEPSMLPRYYQNITADPSIWARKGAFANLRAQDEGKDVLRPGFDPAQMYLDDLQRIYADTLKLFYDPLGGDRFGAVWDPSLKQPRPFRVFNGFSGVPVGKTDEKAKEKERGLVTLNEAAVLSEIARLGSGLVKS